MHPAAGRLMMRLLLLILSFPDFSRALPKRIPFTFNIELGLNEVAIWRRIVVEKYLLKLVLLPEPKVSKDLGLWLLDVVLEFPE